MRAKRKLLFITVFAALLGVGAFAGVSALKNEEPVKIAEAQDISSGLEIRFNIPSDWGWNRNNIHIHTWTDGGPTTSWPGHSMTKSYKNSSNEDVFVFTADSNHHIYDKLIFNDGNNQLAAVDAPSVDTGYYWKGSDFGTYNLTNRYYLYDYVTKYGSTPKVYAWNNNDSSINNVWPGVSMSSMSSITKNNYIFSCDLDVKFDKVIFNGDSKQTGNLTPSPNYVYFENESESDWWDNINFALAHNFREQTMHMRDIPTSEQGSTPECASRYSTAKSAYNALKDSSYWGDDSAGVCHEFKQAGFADTMTRLQKWATANGETFDPSSGSFTPNRAFIGSLSTIISGESSVSVIVIIVISCIAATSIGGYFLFRKKKEN